MLYQPWFRWFERFQWFKWENSNSSRQTATQWAYCFQSVRSLWFHWAIGRQFDVSSRLVIIRTIAPSSSLNLIKKSILNSKRTHPSFEMESCSNFQWTTVRRMVGCLKWFAFWCLKFKFQIRWCQLSLLQPMPGRRRRVTRWWAWHRTISNAWQLATIDFHSMEHTMPDRAEGFWFDPKFEIQSSDPRLRFAIDRFMCAHNVLICLYPLDTIAVKRSNRRRTRITTVVFGSFNSPTLRFNFDDSHFYR